MRKRVREAPGVGGRFGPAAVGALWLAVVACGGGTERVPCRFTVDDDGSRRMTCPDGTSAVFPPPAVAPRTGSVSGSASRFGDPDRDGLDVWLSLATAEPDDDPAVLHAVTDAEGRFRFDDVPPGVHRARFTSPGFFAETRSVVVDPGEFVLDPVVLKRGVESLAGENTALFLSPRGDAFLARYGPPPLQRLAFFEPGGAGLRPLAEGVYGLGSPAYFDATGGLVHCIDYPENSTSGGSLVRYEVDTDRRMSIASDVTFFALALEGDALVFGSGGRLRAWSERFAGPDGSGAIRDLAGETSSLLLGPGGRLLTFAVGDVLVAWDMTTMSGDTLGWSFGDRAFSPDGSVLIAGVEDGLVAWDAEGPRQIRLGPGAVQDVRFHDSGRRFAYLQVEGASRRLVHVDLDRGAVPEVLRNHAVGVAYGPGAAGLAWVESPDDDGEGDLFVSSAPGEPGTNLGGGVSGSSLTWSRDGRRLFFVAYDASSGKHKLDVYEPALGVHDIEDDVVAAPLLEPGGEGVFFYVPEGDGVALAYWSPATDAPITVIPSFDPWRVSLEASAGPGSRLLLPDFDGGWWRWDPSTGVSTFVAENAGAEPSRLFLLDGSVALVGIDQRLRFLEAGSQAPRIVGAGVPPFDGIQGATRDGRRFSYLYGTLGAPPGTLVLFDRDADRAIPLDDDVTTAVQGDRFVAYVRNVPDDDNPQRLFLVTYPVDER